MRSTPCVGLLLRVAVVLLLWRSSEALGQDADGDGVLDPVDNCPFIANPAQGDADLDG